MINYHPEWHHHFRCWYGINDVDDVILLGFIAIAILCVIIPLVFGHEND